MLLLLGRVFLVPMKVMLKFVYNALLGGIIIIIINFVGCLIGFKIALNVFTALIIGLLGIPGIFLLIVLKFIFKV
jgi:inhibitor of the pro-sigma K processing machinery